MDAPYQLAPDPEKTSFGKAAYASILEIAVYSPVLSQFSFTGNSSYIRIAIRDISARSQLRQTVLTQTPQQLSNTTTAVSVLSTSIGSVFQLGIIPQHRAPRQPQVRDYGYVLVTMGRILPKV